MKHIIKSIYILILVILFVTQGYGQATKPIKWENVKHMTLTGTTLEKSAKYAWNNSMTSCNVAQGQQPSSSGSPIQYIEHTIMNNNALYTFGLFEKDYVAPYDRAKYLALIKPGNGLNIYDVGTSNLKYTSYIIGDKIRIERQGNTIRFKRIRNKILSTLLTFTSADANKDYYIKVNLISKDVPIDINMMANFDCEYTAANPAEDNGGSNAINYTETVIYDGLGEDECNILSESRTYFDDMGRPIQSQTRNKSDQIVWASETKYDGFGRAVIQSLPAPTNKNTGRIEYDPNFFNNTNGNPYNWTEDFDKEFNSYQGDGILKMGQTGGVNNPTVLDKSSNGNNGTLGWYYSTNNTENPEQAITDYPYTRTEYSMLTGAQRRVVGPGDAHRMGNGKEASVYAMRVSKFHELYLMFGKGAHPYNVALKYQSDDDGHPTLHDYTGESAATTYTDAVMGNKIVKTITRDNDGKEVVSFTDLDGNELATCLSGQVNGSNVHIQQVSAIIPAGQFRDIHIPDGGSVNTAMSWSMTGECVGGSGDFTFTVHDLTNDQEVDISDLTELGSGLYRITNNPTSGICMRINYTLNYHNFTLNVYNPLKQVIASVPPIGVNYSICDASLGGLGLWGVPAINAADINSVPRHEYLSLFKYNKLGQIEWSQTPDAGRTYFVYAKDGKLRFSQNAKQRSSKQFFYNNYDDEGRLVESGVYSRLITGNGDDEGGSGNPIIRYYFPIEYNFQPSPDKKTVSDANIVANDFVPGSDYLSEQSYIAYSLPQSGSNRTQRFLMGRASKTWDAAGNATWYSYDSEGRIKWTAKQVVGVTGLKYTENTYDLLGNVTKVAYQEDGSDKFVHHYAYNEVGEVLSSATEDRTHTIKVQTKYEYYQDGSVKSLEYAEGLQEMEYTYTIHGWLKGINLDEMNNDNIGIGNKKFSMVLDYYNGDYSAAGGASHYSPMNTLSGSQYTQNYSGDISMWRWKTNVSVTGLTGVNGYHAYRYEYNHRGELASAELGSISEGANFGGVQLMEFTASVNHKVDLISYDLNGNIRRLRRDGVIGDEFLHKIDNLTYHYKQGTNQLDYIGDAHTQNQANTSIGDIKNQAVGNYTYSEIGELTSDNAEDIIIEYNASGKVTAVKEKSTGKLKVRYYYDEGGMRVRKVSYNAAGNIAKTSYYIGGTIYIDDASNNFGLLQKEITINGGGRVGTGNLNYDIITGAYVDISYVYEITDHLGNVRAVIQESTNPSDPVDEIYYADYYPFGWKIPGRNGGESYRYAYQGQEVDDETGWEAFELRMYDGRVGRWMTTDPYSQYHSPYLAMGNNPISRIDPDGGYDFPEVVIYANSSPSYHDYSSERYGYNGYWGDYQKEYDLEGWSRSNYKSYWNNVHSKDWEKWVKWQDKKERERIALERMMRFVQWYELISQVLTPSGGGGPINGANYRGPTTRGVSLNNLKMKSKPSSSGEIVVSEETILNSLKDSKMLTLQDAVSLPMIKRYVKMLSLNQKAPSIKVNNGIIIEGNHRYVAGKLYGKIPETIQGGISPSQLYRVKPIQSIKIDINDWDIKY